MVRTFGNATDRTFGDATGVTVPSQLPVSLGALWASGANDVWLGGVAAQPLPLRRAWASTI